MSDNALDIIVYIALTIGASLLGVLKSSKDKTKRGNPLRHTKLFVRKFTFRQKMGQKEIFSIKFLVNG